MHGLKRHSLVTLQLTPVVEVHSPSILPCAPVPIADLNAKYSIHVLMQVGVSVISSLQLLCLARACMQSEHHIGHWKTVFRRK